MRFIGNIIWLIFGGLPSGLMWILMGIIWCMTIVGIPIGVQCFKFAKIVTWPFGKVVVYGGGSIKMIANIFWLIFSGIPLAIVYVVLGSLWCITILGIPFGKQYFKFAKLALMPFGAEVV